MLEEQQVEKEERRQIEEEKQRQSEEEEVAQRLEEEELTQELEEEQLEEEDTIHPIDDEPSTPDEQPLIVCHLPFIEMGITPPLAYRVTYVCNIMLDQLKKRIVQEIHRYFPNDPQSLVSVATKKSFTSNSRRNLMVVTETNVAFTTLAQDNSKYLFNENVKLRRELVVVKQQVEHLSVKNQ